MDMRHRIFVEATDSNYLPCSLCPIKPLCFSPSLGDEVTDKVEELIVRRRLPRGHYAYRAGDPLKELFFVRQGIFKKVRLDPDGGESVVGFPMVGEVMGLEGFHSKIAANYAFSLEDSIVCEILWEPLLSLALSYPELQQALLGIMSREIAQSQQAISMLGSLPAEERLLTFLLWFSDQYAMRGIPDTQFTLPMSRDEIASFLGLTMETISRAFSKLNANGVVSVRRRHVQFDARCTA